MNHIIELASVTVAALTIATRLALRNNKRKAREWDDHWTTTQTMLGDTTPQS